MKNMEVERVCFRVEHDPYMNKEVILACFPDDTANLGRLCFVPIWFSGNTTYFGCHDEMDFLYYWQNTKPLKNMELAEKCVKEMETFYKTNDYEPHFRIVKRIVRK